MARARGIRLGAEIKMTPEKIAEAERMLLEGKSVAVVAAALGVTPPTIYAKFDQETLQKLREAKQNDESGVRH